MCVHYHKYLSLSLLMTYYYYYLNRQVNYHRKLEKYQQEEEVRLAQRLKEVAKKCDVSTTYIQRKSKANPLFVGLDDNTSVSNYQQRWDPQSFSQSQQNAGQDPQHLRDMTKIYASYDPVSAIQSMRGTPYRRNSESSYMSGDILDENITPFRTNRSNTKVVTRYDGTT